MLSIRTDCIPYGSTIQYLFCFATVFVPFRTFLDTVLMNRFLTLGDGFLIIAFSQFAAVFIAYGIERNHLREVVLIAIPFSNEPSI